MIFRQVYEFSNPDPEIVKRWAKKQITLALMEATTSFVQEFNP